MAIVDPVPSFAEVVVAAVGGIKDAALMLRETELACPAEAEAGSSTEGSFLRGPSLDTSMGSLIAVISVGMLEAVMSTG